EDLRVEPLGRDAGVGGIAEVVDDAEPERLSRHAGYYGLSAPIRFALSSSPSGMVSPRAWPVFGLMTSSNAVGSSTGRSAGLAPLKILCATPAARRYISG